ncbi:MAG: carboxypeptidase regulatory-like domain-containing protein [Planctomycetes bacterium]|nr:carboxypeptidase regulatory-like domain-containing protein [Planctomycetota bacterium]
MRRVVWFLIGVLAAAATVTGCTKESPNAAPAAAPSGDVHAAALVSIPVTVRDFAGAPVGGARVVALLPRPDAPGNWPGMTSLNSAEGWKGLPPRWDLDPRASAQTAADGRATLSGLAPGVWMVAVDAPGRVRREITVNVAPDGSIGGAVAAAGTAGVAIADIELRAETGHPLEGRVLTWTGAPVAGAFVIAQCPGIAPGGRCDAAQSDFATTHTDADGRYRFDALPATIVGVSCSPPGAWSSHVWSVAVPSVPSLDLRMETCGPVEGWVRAEPDGTPVAGADIVFTVETWHMARVTARTTSGADGRYSIPVYPGGGVMSIDVEAPGFCPTPKVVDARQPPFRLYEDRPTVLNLALRPDTDEYADVRGVVRGPDGPVADAKLLLMADQSGPSWSAAARTDATGRFRVFDVPASQIDVIVNSTAGLFLPGTQDSIAGGRTPDARWTIAADATRPVDLDLVMARGGRVSGRVVGENGEPVGGASVVTRGGVRSTSAGDGTFVLEGLDDPADATVWAHSSDDALQGESASFTAGVGADAAGIEVRLRPKAEPARERLVRVTGRVHLTDPATPMTDACVDCDGAWTPLDPSGAFHLEVTVFVGQKEMPVRVVVPGWGERTLDVPVNVVVNAADAPTDAGDIEVPRAVAIRGRVNDRNGPVAGATIGLERKSDFNGIVCGFDEDPSPPIVAVTGPDGSFETHQVAAGSYTIHAAFPGYVEEEASIDVPSDGGGSIDSIQLCREAFIRGRVTRGGGRPVRSASVRVTEDDGTNGAWLRRTEYGRTNSDGTFEVRVREGFSYDVEVSPNRDGDEFRKTTSGPHTPGGEPVEILVTAGETISGRVVYDAGSPAAGVSVSGELTSRRYDGSHETRSAADGTFTLTALADAQYDITVVAGLADAVCLREVKAGASDAAVRLPAPTVIEGVLLGSDGKPAAGWALVATRMRIDWDRADVQVSAVTDAEGRFRLVGTGETLCRIELNKPDRDWDSDESTWPLVGGIDVAPGTEDVVLRIPTKAATTIAGRVVDDAGKPFADFSVWIPTRPNSTTWHSGGAAGSKFEGTGLRLDAPCNIVAEFAGLRGRLSVPVGTADIVLTAGPDGLHTVEFGGAVHASLPVEARLGDAVVGHRTPSAKRLVHALSGTIVAIPGVDRTKPSRRSGPDVVVPNLPVGPYRLEGLDDTVGEWRPYRVGSDQDGATFVWDN